MLKLLYSVLAISAFALPTLAKSNNQVEAKGSAVTQQFKEFKLLTKKADDNADFYYIVVTSDLRGRYGSFGREDSTQYKKVIALAPQIRKHKRIEVIYLEQDIGGIAFYKGAPFILTDVIKKNAKLKSITIYHGKIAPLLPHSPLKKHSTKECVYLFNSDGTLVHSGTEELLEYWKECTISPTDEKELQEKLEKRKQELQQVIDKKKKSSSR